MSWVAVAVAGAGIGGALISSNASKQAANTQANSAQQAQNTQWDMFNKTQGNLAPWMQGGQNANQALLQYLGIGQNGQFNPNAPGVAPFNASMLPGDPSYQWRFQQGENALLNARSAIGGLNSGNTLKALTNYGQGQASQQYQQALQNYMAQQKNVNSLLGGVSDTGVNAAGGIARLGANAADNVSSLQASAGQANAAGTLGQANAINQGIGGLTNQWLYADALQQRGGQGVPQNYLYNSAFNPYDASNPNNFFTPG